MTKNQIISKCVNIVNWCIIDNTTNGFQLGN